MDPVPTTLCSFEQSMRILDLAFDYLSIDPSGKDKIIKALEKQFQDDSNINLTDIFRHENLISDEDIEYFRIFDTHLQTLSLDLQFGRIAVANGLASEEDIAKALKDQQTNFEKYRINLYIGDILVENSIITHSDRVSILLTQNRIRNENLLDALNDIGKTLMEKDAANKRFGVLAIKNGLATIEQVNAALEVQKKEKSAHKNPRFIGSILQETANLPDTDLQQLLIEQQQFEKRRLDLEKALYPVKAEIKISKKLNQLFEYSISKDGIEVFVRKIKKTNQVIPVYEFLIWLRRAGIKFGLVKDSVLEEFIQQAEKNTQVIVARGIPAEQGTHEKIEFYFKNEFTTALKIPDDNAESTPVPMDEEPSGDDEMAEAEKESHPPDFFKKGSLLARIIPGKEGKQGRDVLGFPIQPGKPYTCQLNAGSGVIKKDAFFFAQADGCPILKKDTIHMIEPVAKKVVSQTIRGNISSNTEDAYESVNVEISGDLTHGAVLKCHNLVLHGSLMGSVNCSGDIDVKGNIGTDEKPGDNTIQQADIVSKGSVKASRSIIKAKIQTSGEFMALHSTVTGSDILACNGMIIKDVFAPSILRFGLKPGDKILVVDHMIETKNFELSVLKKEDEINKLTEEYRKDLETEESYQIEQAILKNIVEIIEAPELYHFEGLDNKIKHLYRLPDFSSIKAYYLKLPETETGLAVRNQIIASKGEMPLDKFLSHIQKRIDPKPADETEISNIHRIESQYKGRLALLNQEIADQSEEIKKRENEIKGLESLRTKLQSIHVGAIARSASEIKIKNMCEKGTIIQGRIARLVVEKTLYNIKFKEVVDPKTKTVSIIWG